MTVLDRCANIGLQISQRNKLRRAHKDAEAFRARAGDLKSSRELVEDAIERVVVLRKKDVVVAMLSSPDAAITVLAECQAKLAANPVESGSDYGRLKRSVDKFGKDLLGIAEKALKSVRQDLPTVDEVFLRQVADIPGYADRVSRIRQQRDALLNGNDPRLSSEALEQFLDHRKALRRLADDLKPDEFPNEVLAFFKAGRHSLGAPLERLTPSVRQWLSDRDLLKHVRVQVVVR